MHHRTTVGTSALRRFRPGRAPLFCTVCAVSWSRWVLVALCSVQGGYMVLDGARALAVGSYITPGSGEHAGRLGPWARLVDAG